MGIEVKITSKQSKVLLEALVNQKCGLNRSNPDPIVDDKLKAIQEIKTQLENYPKLFYNQKKENEN